METNPLQAMPSLTSLTDEMGKLNLNDNISQISSTTNATNKSKKRKIGFCFDERMLLHRDSKHVHQECPERAMSVYINLVLKELTNKLIRIQCEEAKEEDLLRVHTEEYLNKIKEISENNSKNKNVTNHNLSEKDSYDNFATYESAKLATGSLIEICKNILSKKIEHGYAIIRPPGHHADMSTARGFCIFNSVAVAVKYILNKNDKIKIAILDWDVHHGDGTQAIFYNEQNPLFISIHRHDNGKFYPFKTGFVEEKGDQNGIGYNINIPLDTKCAISKGPSCIGDAEYINIFEKIIMPCLTEYNPDIIFISCGYDAGENDFSGCLKCSPFAYAFMTERLLSLNKNLIFALEGGYTLDTIKRMSETTIRTLLGEETPWKGNMIQNYLDFNNDNFFNLDYLMNNWENIFRVVPYVAEHLNIIIDEHKKNWKCLENNNIKIKDKYKPKKIEENKDKENTNTNVNNNFFLRKDVLSNEQNNINEILTPLLLLNKEDFYNKHEEFIIFKIGEELVNNKNDINVYYNKKILSYRTCLKELKFNIESIKFTKLRANATRIYQLLNWDRDEMKYDMNSNIISEILMLFFQNLKMKNKEVLALLDSFIKKMKNILNNIDLFNCDLIIIPKIIPLEDNDKNTPKKKTKLFSKKDKIEFEFFINGIKNKNISIYSNENSSMNKQNFIKGLEGLRNFINENVMN
jgi:acetoin utilization deacetylase AcuC-like enzyme